jgi:hypothetical protein
MVDSTQSKGEFFSRAYIERGPPTRDSQAFRNRLTGYLEANHRDEFYAIASVAKQELGLVVDIRHGVHVYADVPDFVQTRPMPKVLDLITVIWRVLQPRYGHTNWREFVARAMRDENLGYSIDEIGGVHYLVDEEFERNRISVLRAVETPRYAAVRAAFESAHSYLDAQPPDTKACVRSMFEALEILARLMESGAQRLNRQLVEKLKVSATWLNADAVEVKALERIFDSFADWVDAMHMYRHGQAVEEPVAPSIEFAVYALSSGAATLRLLLGVDASTPGRGQPISP